MSRWLSKRNRKGIGSVSGDEFVSRADKPTLGSIPRSYNEIMLVSLCRPREFWEFSESIDKSA